MNKRMPSWSDLQAELKGIETEKRGDHIAERMRQLAMAIDTRYNRNVLYYASSFLQKPQVPGVFTSINMEDINGMAHTNGIESFWSMLKRAHKRTFHKISPKHRRRCVNDFSGKLNIRVSDTIVQLRDTVARLVGRHLLLRNLIACNGFSNSGR